MPTTKTKDPIKGDRIIDYLDEVIDMAPDGSLQLEGHLGPDGKHCVLYDRPKEARGPTDRRYLLRLSSPTGEEARQRVFNHEESAVSFLDGIERGLEMKRKPRGAAAKKVGFIEPTIKDGPTIRNRRRHARP